MIAGGIINAWGTNARIGKGEWMVVEADESDGTFLKLPTQIGVVTNIDPEHMDYWQTFEAMHHAIPAIHRGHSRITGSPWPASIIRWCASCSPSSAAPPMAARTLTYGVRARCRYQAHQSRPARDSIVFDAMLGSARQGGARMLEDLMLPVLGHYNALNALAALAVATEAGVSDEVIRAASPRFSGVKRRFSHAGEWQGVPSMTTTRIIRWRSPPCCAPRAMAGKGQSSP